MGENEKVTSRERIPGNVKFEPKDKSELLKEPVAKILRLEAPYMGGKLARKVKAAQMNNLQAVIY